MTSKIETNNCRILVCGSSHVGKTSLINLLLTGNPSKTKNNGQEIIYSDKKFTFTEAKGFELNDKGIFFNTTAERNLKNSLSRIKDGFNLVIHVIKKGSILETDKLNYDMIVRDLFKEKINVLCVTTFLDEEEGENLINYWKNLEVRLKKRGFNYTYGVGVCCAKSINKVLEEIYQNQRAISYKLLWDAILSVTYQTEKKKPTYSFLKGGYEESRLYQLCYGTASDETNGINNSDFDVSFSKILFFILKFS
jgi:GTPase SAR1 family protein